MAKPAEPNASAVRAGCVIVPTPDLDPEEQHERDRPAWLSA